MSDYFTGVIQGFRFNWSTRLILVAGVVGGLAGSVNAGDDAALRQRVQQSRALAQSLMQALKTELQSAIRSGGPVGAIKVCNTQAGHITEAQAREVDGWAIRRTSLRVRNTENAPDDWERAVLEQFELRKNAGEDLNRLEHFAVVEQGGVKVFRWMKAIPTGEVCVVCHGGDAVGADVAATISALYPDDKARGFNVGDIRGAFSVTQKLE